MIATRVFRTLGSIGLSISLAVGLMTIPATSLAALPTVHTGFGTDSHAAAQPSTGATPPTVAPGEPVAFQVWARNDDTSNVSKFYLSAITSGTLSSATWTKDNGESGTCAPSSKGDCTFGSLRPGVTVYVTAIFTTPSSGPSMGVNFVFSTTGFGSGSGDNSHGDAFPRPDSVALNADANFGGRYVQTDALKTVQTNPVLGTGNKQSTVVFSPTTGIGVTVQDGPGVTSGCAEGVSCFGETSEIHVGNGSGQYGQFKIVINLHKSEIPSGVKASNLVVYHDGVAITATCGKTPVADCKCVKKFTWGLQVTIWAQHNGKFNMG